MRIILYTIIEIMVRVKRSPKRKLWGISFKETAKEEKPSRVLRMESGGSGRGRPSTRENILQAEVGSRG